MATSFLSAKTIADALTAKNRRSTRFPAMEIEVEVREDFDGYIDFYTISVKTDQIKTKRNWAGNELLYAGGRHINSIESNAHKVIMEHIEKLKPLPRKLK